MAKYICTKAEFATIDNGSNKGSEYITAKFQLEGTDIRSGRLPRTYNFFPPTGLEEEFHAAWQPTVDASEAKNMVALLDPNSEAYFAIEGHVFSVKVEPHAKKYQRDTTVAGVVFKAGQAIRVNGDPKHVQKFDTVNVFTECTYASDGSPIPVNDVQRIAQRMFERSCTPWDKVPAELKLNDPSEVKGTGSPELTPEPKAELVEF